MFLSSYDKAELMTGMGTLFALVDERNSENDYAVSLQFAERLKIFIEHESSVTDVYPIL